VKVDPNKGTVIAAIEDEPDDDATDWSDPRHHGNEIGLLTVSSFVRANDAYFNC
jgi:hypothetical protein